MLSTSQTLSLLQVVVPADTGLSVASELMILEILGIVSNPDTVKSMNLALNLVPAGTPATLHGFVQLLTGLAKQHPKFTTKHHDSVSKLLKSLDAVPDAVLTFGTFLPICEALLKGKKHV